MRVKMTKKIQEVPPGTYLIESHPTRDVLTNIARDAIQGLLIGGGVPANLANISINIEMTARSLAPVNFLVETRDDGDGMTQTEVLGSDGSEATFTQYPDGTQTSYQRDAAGNETVMASQGDGEDDEASGL